MVLKAHYRVVLERHLFLIADIRLCNRLTIFKNGPLRVVQILVDLLVNGQVAAAAELIFKGDRLAVLQDEAAVFIHQHRAGFFIRGILCVFGGHQGTRRCRSIIRNFFLSGGEAGDHCRHSFGREHDVAQINVARVVAAKQQLRYVFIVEAIHCFHLGKIQLDGDPLVVFHRHRAVDRTIQERLVQAAPCVFVFILQLQVHVAQRCVALV